MNEPEKPNKGWGCLQWGAVLCVLVLLCTFCLSVMNVISDMASQEACLNSNRQIIMAMRIWAMDHDEAYPDSVSEPNATANVVFRQLFKDEIVSDDRVFGGHRSPFRPDGNIGVEPDFKQAVEVGENHWMIVAGLTTKSPGYYPLVFENTLTPSWPLQWSRSHKTVRGRSWRGGRIIIGRNDNSVNVETLVKDGEQYVLPELPNQKSDDKRLTDFKLLDIEEK